jgi:hypothetical protein
VVAPLQIALTAANDHTVQRDLTTFLAANGWPRYPAGYGAFIDLLSFTTVALRRHLNRQ